MLRVFSVAASASLAEEGWEEAVRGVGIRAFGFDLNINNHNIENVY